MIVMKYFKSTKTKVQKMKDEAEAEKPPPKVEEDFEEEPLNTPLVEALSSTDLNATALRWQCIDPILVGSVSAHALRENDLARTPTMSPNSSMMMSRGSLYGPPMDLPPALPGA